MCREAALKLKTLKIEPVDLMVEVGREANLMGETQSAAPVLYGSNLKKNVSLVLELRRSLRPRAINKHIQ